MGKVCPFIKSFYLEMTQEPQWKGYFPQKTSPKITRERKMHYRMPIDNSSGLVQLSFIHNLF